MFQITTKWVAVRVVDTMMPTHSRHTRSRSEAGRGSTSGSIALLFLFAAALVAVSYPWLTFAVVAGGLGAILLRRGYVALRRRRIQPVRTQEAAAGVDIWTPSPPASQSVSNRVSESTER